MQQDSSLSPPPSHAPLCEPVLHLGDLCIDRQRQLVTRDGVEITLPHLSYTLLLTLVDAAPYLVSAEQLMERVWPSQVVGPETLAQRVKLLRQALGDDSRNPRYIEGVRGRGYRLVARVSLFDGGRETNAAPPPTHTAAVGRPGATLPRASVMLGLALALVTVMAVWLLRSPPDQPVISTTPEISLAVLPLRDLSPTQDQGWLADGISEELGALLSRVEGMLVIKPNSAFQFRNAEQDMQTIAQTLRVEYLLSGSLRRDNNTLKLTVSLTNTHDGKQLWSEIFERQLDDVFAIQTEIAEAVSTALQITLATGTFGRMPGMTRNTEAYTEFLKARAVSTRDTLLEPRRVLQHLERALVLDPDFSTASTMLYFYYANTIPYVASIADFPDREARMAEALTHMRATDPGDPNLLLVESFNNAANSRWLEAEAKFNAFLDAALQRFGPGRNLWLYNANANLAGFYRDTGNLRASIPLLERALTADPLNAGIHVSLSESLAASGNFTRALEINTDALALPGLQDDALLVGSRLLLVLGERNPALLDDFQSFDAAFDADVWGINRLMLTNRGDPARALQLLREQAENTALPAQQLNSMSAWAAYFDDPEFALELLDRRRQYTAYVLGSFLARPVYAEVRKLHGFKQLVTELGLVDYWRASNNWGDYCRPLSASDKDFECF